MREHICQTSYTLRTVLYCTIYRSQRIDLFYYQVYYFYFKYNARRNLFYYSCFITSASKETETGYLRIIECLQNRLGYIKNSSTITAHHEDKTLRSLKQEKAPLITSPRSNINCDYAMNIMGNRWILLLIIVSSYFNFLRLKKATNELVI